MDGMLVHHRATPSIKFAGTRLYTWVERGTVRVEWLAQEHNQPSWGHRASHMSLRARPINTSPDRQIRVPVGNTQNNKVATPKWKQSKLLHHHFEDFI